MRATVAVAVGAAVAALGGLILAEYVLSVATAVLGGLLFGLAVAESALWVGRRRGWMEAGVYAALAAVGVVWGGWLSVRHARGAPIPGEAWLAAAVAGVVAGVRARPGRPAGR